MRIARALGVLSLAVGSLVLTSKAALAELTDGPVAADQEYQRWQYVHSIPLAPPSEPAQDESTREAARWYDFVLTPEVFSGARLDLGDLRLVDAKGNDVQYALRVRAAEYRDDKVTASQFNEVQGAGGSREWSYDLGPDSREHNQLEVDTKGDEFRRLAVVEGSDDGQKWLKLTERHLLRFHPADTKQREFDVRQLRYTPSRYRYLRLRIERDPLVDKDPVEVVGVQVQRRIEVPGEFIRQPTRIDPREATRAWGAPASAWILHLPGRQQPVARLIVDFAEAEFARDYQIEVPESDEPGSRFMVVASGKLQRRAGDARKPLEVDVSGTAARLRLSIIDHGNQPLELTSALVEAPARQIVFARQANLAGPLRLYYGNPKAEPPHYDLERNLPVDPQPPPLRLALEPQASNPAYEPEPLPLSERVPWLIYVVLGGASLLVAAILVDVGRTSIARHDAAEPAAAL